MTTKNLDRFLFKKGYNYLEHFKNDCAFLANKFLAVNEIGNDLINKIDSINNLDSILHLNSNLSYLSNILLANIKIFCGKWNEIFCKTFKLKFNNNNPFYFVNNVFILNKHGEREINDFYHGLFSISDNIDEKSIQHMQKLFNNMKNGNIYNSMRALKNYSRMCMIAYLNKCKEQNSEYWPLKDFKNISIEEFLNNLEVFLPEFNSYVNVLFRINENIILWNETNDKTRYQENIKLTKQILRVFNIKKVWNLFIIDQWNQYIDSLQNLMYFFNVFMYINLYSNNINDFTFFKSKEFCDKTNWYEKYINNLKYWVKEGKKYHLTKLTKLKRNNKTN